MSNSQQQDPLVIRPGGISNYFIDFGQQEVIFQDGLHLIDTATVTFNAESTPPGAPSFPTLGSPSIVTPSVNPAGTGILNGNQVTGVNLTAGGSGWPNPPATVWCTFTGGGGWGAVGICQVSEGAVVGVKMVSPGNGYASAPTAVFHQACIVFEVTTVSAQNGFTFQIQAISPVSDNIQTVEAEGQILVTW